MGVLEQVLAAVDNAKRVAGRNVSDLVSSPALYAERMTDALRNSNANVVPTASPTELTNRPMTRDEVAKKYVDASMDTFGGGLGVIKPKGGNWLSGTYGPEAQLKGLKKAGSFGADSPEELAGMMGMPLNEAQAFWKTEPVNLEKQAVNSFVDRQLTKYIKNDMASPTDPIRLMADRFPAEKAQKLAEAEARVSALRQKQQAQAATRGVPEEYLTQTRQDVLRAEEARDVIAENTGLHYTPAVIPRRPGTILEADRVAAGFPAKGMGQTDLAKSWETSADYAVAPRRAEDFQLYDNLKQDPWLAKANPEASINVLDSNALNSIRAPHLIDELRNSVAAGKITPEALGKMNMEQAVRHVAEVNALRAVESNKARAMDMADMPMHKEYPENGMSWRQLKQVEEGQAGYDKLGKWLKDEGDAMGHCVGGYCDDVASGQSSIYSLRDAKGKPSVTIETTKPELQNPRQWLDHNDSLPDEYYTRLPDELTLKNFKEYDRIIESSPEYQAYLQTVGTPRIEQIKGPKNQSPDPQYFPMIQDFIRSGKWSDIQDAGNTGLTPAEIQQILKGQQ